MKLSSYVLPAFVLSAAQVLGAPAPTSKTTSSTKNPLPTSGSPSGPGTSPTQNSSSSVAFAADPSINVAAIYAAAQSATGNPLASGIYATTTSKDAHQTQIYGDWLTLASGGVSAFHFIADMDIDCDGPDVRWLLFPVVQHLT
jgi:hypothetical protein